MEKSLHEWARELLALPDKPYTISVDISTGEKDANDRVFTDEFLGINNVNAEELVLLFSGTLNK